MLAVFAMSSMTAYAADGNTIYPTDEEFTKTLTFTALTDYAVEDGLYAFADGRMVKVYSDGKYTEYAFDYKVTGVEISEGVIYCACLDEKTYTVTTQLECDYTFTENPASISFNNFYYYFKGDTLKIFDEVNETVVNYEGYANLKQFGESVYAIGENKLMQFDGSEAREVMLEYAIDKSDLKITIGTASSDLKKYAPLQFVEIEEGSFITEIDLDKLNGEFFVPLSLTRTENKITALRLCDSGNATIVSIKGTAYAVLKTKVREIAVDAVTDKPFEHAQMIGGNIYASPCVVSGTVATSSVAGTTVTVLNRFEYEDILECAFYEVEYTVGGTSVKGFVAEGFLTEDIREDNKQPTEVTDPNYAEGNDTKTIIIIFAVALLALIAIVYIAHVSSKGKKKKKKTKPSDEE